MLTTSQLRFQKFMLLTNLSPEQTRARFYLKQKTKNYDTEKVFSQTL